MSGNRGQYVLQRFASRIEITIPKFREFVVTNEPVIFILTAVPNAQGWIEITYQLRRITGNNTVTGWERLGNDGIRTDDREIAQLNARKNYSTHADPAIRPNSDCFRRVAPIVKRVVIRANDSNIRCDLRVVPDYDFSDTLDITSRHEPRGRLDSNLDVFPAVHYAGWVNWPVGRRGHPSNSLPKPGGQSRWRLCVRSIPGESKVRQTAYCIAYLPS